MLLYLISVFTTHGKCKKVMQKQKISAPMWNKKFELSDRSYSV